MIWVIWTASLYGIGLFVAIVLVVAANVVDGAKPDRRDLYVCLMWPILVPVLIGTLLGNLLNG